MSNKIKKIIILCILIFISIIIHNTKSMAKSVELSDIDSGPEKTAMFGVASIDMQSFKDIIIVPDGYITVGGANLKNNILYENLAKGNSYLDAVIVKYDKQLNVVWVKALGGSLEEEFSSINKTKDGGYLIYGYTTSRDGDLTGINTNTSTRQNMCVKYSSNWNIEFIKTGNLTELQQEYDSLILQDNMGQISDGRIKLETIYSDGNIAQIPSNYKEINTRITKYDNLGYEQWVKVYDRTNNYKTDDKLTKAIEIEDGYIFIGSTGINVEEKYKKAPIIVKYKKPSTDIKCNCWGGNKLVIGEELQWELHYIPYLSVTEEEIIWSSSNNSVVTVETIEGSKAKITAVGNGEATISIKIRQKETTYKVYVIQEGQLQNAEYKILDEKQKKAELVKVGTVAGTVVIPQTVKINGKDYNITSIGDKVFYCKSKLTNVVLPEGLETIGSQAFANTRITNLTIPNSVKNIEERAFYLCDLESVDIPESVVNIGDGAFSWCSELTSVTIPKSITSIGRTVFLMCTKLANVNLPDSITSIGNNAFARTALTNITLPSSLKTIGEEAFYSSELTNIVIPKGVTSIGKGAFNYCTKLISITIPRSVTSIGASFIPDNTKTIYTYKGAYAEIYSNIKTVIILPEEEIKDIGNKYGIIDNNKRTIEIYGCNENVTTLKIPDTIEIEGIKYTVTRIADKAFYYNSNLRNVEISENVTNIGSMAFYGCKNLNSVIILGDTSVTRNSFDRTNATIYSYNGTKTEQYVKTKNIFLSDRIKINDIPTQTYSGKAIQPKLVIKDKDIILKEGIDYTATYKNNIEVGTATVIITGKGKYSETINKTFNIQKRPIIVENCPFTDVPKNSYYYSAVNYCNKNKIILGTTATTFSPNKNLTRGMLVTILWRMEGSKILNVSQKFTDVKIDQYYYDAIKWASTNKIVNGYGDGKFKPNNNITREQLVTILKNYANYKKKDTTARKDLTTFTDNKGISDYARDSISWAVAKKIINGKVNGTKIDPRGTATRAEAAVMIQNYCNYVGR